MLAAGLAITAVLTVLTPLAAHARAAGPARCRWPGDWLGGRGQADGRRHPDRPRPVGAVRRLVAEQADDHPDPARGGSGQGVTVGEDDDHRRPGSQRRGRGDPRAHVGATAAGQLHLRAG